VTWSLPVLASNNVTEVLPLSFGVVVAPEPHPVVTAMASNKVRAQRKKVDDEEGAEKQAAFMEDLQLNPFVSPNERLNFRRELHYMWNSAWRPY
jgi:hypothetical protein